MIRNLNFIIVFINLKNEFKCKPKQQRCHRNVLRSKGTVQHRSLKFDSSKTINHESNFNGCPT